MRTVLAAVAVAIAFGANAQDKVLRVVPHSNLNILDPIWTTQYMARNHGYMVYDTLFGTDEKSRVQPQMVFFRLQLTEKDGWKPPQDFQQQAEEAKKWLKDNADKYRIPRFVNDAKEKKDK